MELIQYPQEKNDNKIRDEIITLEQTAWPREGEAAFYTKCGFEPIPGACFIGGTKEKPFRSDELGLVTMMRFVSEESRACEKDFENTDIIFELGEGQLW